MLKVKSNKSGLAFLTFFSFLLVGCYSNELIKDLNPAKTDLKDIRLIELRDGSAIDLTDNETQIELYNINENGITYKSADGTEHSVPTGQIYRVFIGELNILHSIFTFLGMITIIYFFARPPFS